MGKRAFWFAVGAGAGAFGAVWGLSSVRRANDRLRPEQLQGRAGQRVKAFGSDVRDAVAKGREAMRDREAELRDRESGHSRPTPLR